MAVEQVHAQPPRMAAPSSAPTDPALSSGNGRPGRATSGSARTVEERRAGRPVIPEEWR
jgi:hypothetical protein